MTEETFREGQKAYCVRVGYNEKVDWTVFQVVRVLPKSLKLRDESDTCKGPFSQPKVRLKHRTNDGCFYDYMGAVIKPSEKAALEAAINKVMANLVSCRKRMTEYEKDLELLQHELLNLEEPINDPT